MAEQPWLAALLLPQPSSRAQLHREWSFAAPLSEEQPLLLAPLSEVPKLLLATLSEEQPLLLAPLSEEQPLLLATLSEEQPLLLAPLSEEQPLLLAPLSEEQPSMASLMAAPRLLASQRLGDCLSLSKSKCLSRRRASTGSNLV
jgi:hypothetical protein